MFVLTLSAGLSACGDSGAKKAGVKKPGSGDAIGGGSPALAGITISVYDLLDGENTNISVPAGVASQLRVDVSGGETSGTPSLGLGSDTSQEITFDGTYLNVSTSGSSSMTATIVARDYALCTKATGSESDCQISPSSSVTADPNYDKTHTVYITVDTQGQSDGGPVPVATGSGAGTGTPAGGAGDIMGTMAGLMGGGAGGGAGGMMGMLGPLMGMLGGGGGAGGGDIMGMLGPLMGMLGGGTTLTSDEATQENQNSE